MIKWIFCIYMLILTCRPEQDKPIVVNFNGNKWLFPLTVGEATTRYHFSFKSSGYYYAQMKNGSTVYLEYTYKAASYFNEHQPKEVLYDRNVESYMHSFEDKPGLLDSLHVSLEKQFNKRLVMSADTQRFGLKNMSTSLRSKLPNSGVVAYQLMQVDSALVIGLRQKPKLGKGSQVTEVILFYKMSQNQIKKRMVIY